MRSVFIAIIAVILLLSVTSCAIEAPEDTEANYTRLDAKAGGVQVFLSNDAMEEIVIHYEKKGAKVVKKENEFALLETNRVRITIVPNDFNDEYTWAIIKTKK